jgi:hypothetical protein
MERRLVLVLGLVVPAFTAVFSSAAHRQPQLYKAESARRVDFQTAGWTLAGLYLDGTSPATMKTGGPKVLVTQWLTIAGVAGAIGVVPEPATAALVALGGVAALLRPKRGESGSRARGPRPG